MEKEVIAAIISSVATIAAAVIGVIASVRQKQKRDLRGHKERKPRVAIEDRTSLTLKELSAIRIEASPTGQLAGHTKEELPFTGEAEVKLIFPGDSKFKNKSSKSTDETGVMETMESWMYSAITIFLDGESVGAGSGDRGFQVTFRTWVGRHVLIFSWDGSYRCNSDEEGEEVKDQSGRVELVFWLVRAGQCVIHLTSEFSIDYSEPGTAFNGCCTCRMPGLHKCSCGNHFCNQHLGVMRDKQVCEICFNRDQQKRDELAREAEESARAAMGCWAAMLLLVGLIGGGVALYYYLKR